MFINMCGIGHYACYSYLLTLPLCTGVLSPAWTESPAQETLISQQKFSAREKNKVQ